MRHAILILALATAGCEGTNGDEPGAESRSTSKGSESYPILGTISGLENADTELRGKPRLETWIYKEEAGARVETGLSATAASGLAFSLHLNIPSVSGTSLGLYGTHSLATGLGNDNQIMIVHGEDELVSQAGELTLEKRDGEVFGRFSAEVVGKSEPIQVSGVVHLRDGIVLTCMKPGSAGGAAGTSWIQDPDGCGKYVP